jgi:hypothetical protein
MTLSFAGVSLSQSGATSRKLAASVPVARCPTYAKLLVQASTNCIA